MKASGSYVLNDDHTIVAKVMVLPGTHCVTWTEFEAIEIEAARKAVLFAAAPELLAALDALQDAAQSAAILLPPSGIADNLSKAWLIARAALKKASGEA